MTDKRQPESGKYKQVYYCDNRSRPYTQAKIGHDDYIQTDVWKKIRAKRLAIDFYRCSQCGSAIDVQVHHVCYPEVWGEESLDDLVTLCASCHAEVHKHDIANKEVIK